MTVHELCQYAASYDITITEAQGELLLSDMAQVLLINQTHNLTAIKTEDEFVDKHLIDSILCDLSHLSEGSKVLDIGTGGGFPGIPLAIIYPKLNFTLMDSTEKKIHAVETIAAELGLSNVQCIADRAENMAKSPLHREHYDAVVSRGVATYNVLAELCFPFVKIGGSFFAWKGPHYKEELEQSEKALSILGGKISQIKKKELIKTSEIHVIIEAQKMKETPKKYPRNYGAIKKKPL